jgi:hypothetical protein
MKSISLIAACLLALGAFNGLAQGTVNFNNRVTAAGLDAPLFDFVGIHRLEGPNAFAQIYHNDAPVGAPVAFRTGVGAGYFSGGTVAIPGVAGGASATLVVVWWKDAPTYESASIKAFSMPFTVTLGGAGEPPSIPANLIGLTSFTLCPEPSTLALGLLSVCGLFLRRIW